MPVSLPPVASAAIVVAEAHEMKQGTAQNELVSTPNLEARTREIGRRLFELAEQAGAPSLFSKRGVYGKLMQWTLSDQAFKTQLFRFVDVFPTLRTSAEVADHYQEYIQPHLHRAPLALRLGLKTSARSSHLLGAGISVNITGMARLFMIEKKRSSLVKTLRELHERGIAFTVDLLGETVLSEREADEYASECSSLLNLLAEESARWGASCQGEAGADGALPRANLSIKISALYSQINPADPGTALNRLKDRLRPLLRQAVRLGAFINFDIEQYRIKDLTLALFQSLLEEDELGGYPHAGLALQAYLRESEADLRAMILWGRQRKQPFTVRLVKGAYWDYETVVARQRNWPVPVFLHKTDTDANFERLTRLLLENADLVAPAFGSHNVRSLAHAIAQAERLGVDSRRFEIQVLHGMAAPLAEALVKLGYRVREYCPTGELVPGMAYLVRRLLENSSNEGFLASRFALGRDADFLLRNPAESLSPEEPRPPPETFRNCPNLDFTRAEAREGMRRALGRVRRRLGYALPLRIGGKNITTRETIPSLNPADPSSVIAYASRATEREAERAVQAAGAAAHSWAETPPEERAALLEATAGLMEERRHDLAALEVFEAAKAWAEADADVCEAIDFCRYYALRMRRLAVPELTQEVPGEENRLYWLPRGVGVVIAPWNFPLAILCGMTAAALVTGNTVIMKPAEQTPILAGELINLFEEAGIPVGAVNLVTGYGDVGEFLANHPAINFVAFTGSREVGLKIWETAGRTRPGQSHLKQAVCEMGGKNAMIIDSDADLDEAVAGVLASAFGYQGQKCSALSRLIVLDDIYDALLRRLLDATASLPVGDPAIPGTILGPVIDAEARDRVLKYIEVGKSEATLAFQGEAPPGNGFFIPPTIFTEVPPDARIAREEIFGPVLAVFRARDFEAAILLANDTDFALTGGIYSRSPSHIEKAKAEMRAGNLYINRSITGAIVERHPFGGYGMSGGGTKAGGREYLLHFMIPRVVSENQLRHGFAPPEDLMR